MSLGPISRERALSSRQSCFWQRPARVGVLGARLEHLQDRRAVLVGLVDPAAHGLEAGEEQDVLVEGDMRSQRVEGRLVVLEEGFPIHFAHGNAGEVAEGDQRCIVAGRSQQPLQLKVLAERSATAEEARTTRRWPARRPGSPS